MFTIEQLRRPNWQRLRELRIAALSESDSIHGDLDLETSAPAQYWHELLTNGTWIALKWNSDDVGLLVVAPPPPDRYGDCWIKSWWISPNFRNRGGARLMLDWLTDFCYQRHWRIQALGVFESNLDAIATYQRLGFRQVGERKPASRENEFFIIMARHLSHG